MLFLLHFILLVVLVFSIITPILVGLWYGIGIICAIWVIYDEMYVNKRVNKSLKAAWPITMIFLSVISLTLYIWTCRPPKIGNVSGELEQKIHHDYVSSFRKRVTGSAIHCVAGDGLGIVTAMIISRIYRLPFFMEFGFEYVVGFLFGWLIFQYVAIRSMGDSRFSALWKAFRAEFFSMITLMLGMGIVTGFVVPIVLATPPGPGLAAFWGFASLGLVVGTIFTYPMNWWLVSKGWKHGMS